MNVISCFTPIEKNVNYFLQLKLRIYTADPIKSVAILCNFNSPWVSICRVLGCGLLCMFVLSLKKINTWGAKCVASSISRIVDIKIL